MGIGIQQVTDYVINKLEKEDVWFESNEEFFYASGLFFNYIARRSKWGEERTLGKRQDFVRTPSMDLLFKKLDQLFRKEYLLIKNTHRKCDKLYAAILDWKDRTENRKITNREKDFLIQGLIREGNWYSKKVEQGQ